MVYKGVETPQICELLLKVSADVWKTEEMMRKVGEKNTWTAAVRNIQVSLLRLYVLK